MRFINVAGELTLQAKLRDTWEHIYRVIPYPRYDGEYEIVNWYTGIDTGTLAGFGPAAMMANDNNLIRSSPIPA
jgi:hypothetical protein